MQFFRYKVTMKTAWTPAELRYTRPIVTRLPFRWLAILRGWIWLKLNLFPGELRATVEKIEP